MIKTKIIDLLKTAWDKIKDVIAWADFINQLEPITTFGYKDVEEVLKGLGLKYYEIEDSQFKIMSIEDVEKFLQMNVARIKRYKANDFDCEDFSDILRGQSKLLIPGYLLGRVNVYTPKGKHALNFVINKDKEFMYLEPQNNKIFNLAYGKRFYGYKPYLVIV